MPTPDFALAVSRRQHELVVELDGELDLATGPMLSTAIADVECDGAAAVVVDLRGIRFVDAKGLGALLEARRQLDERGMTMRVVNPRPAVLRVLRVAGVDGVLLNGEAGH